ncbi:MAG: adenylate/guanylate cyclase domain-containing protein [Kiloniellales bacterium]
MNTLKHVDLVEWIVAQGLAGQPETRLFAEICKRLSADGLPLLRANIHVSALHPVIGGHLFIWWRGDQEALREDWRRADAVLRSGQLSPFESMILNNQEALRLRLDREETAAAFPLFERLRQRGGTDYLAMQVRFGQDRAFGPVDRVLFSWLTDLPDGFQAAHLEELRRIMPSLALAVKAASGHRVANDVIETYLGRDAAQRVLKGDIERGMGETIRAALWYCDLKGFTRLSDTVPRDHLLAMLDEYFEVMVTTLHEFQGQVLKFTGDGLLAIFNLEDDPASCRAAHAAAEQVTSRIDALSAERATAGLPVSDFRIGLHLGEVLFGNVGARGRLDFTVVGPAVNEVSRIEAMCRPLEQRLLISSTFARVPTDLSDNLVSLGRYALRGVRQPQELFTLAPPPDEDIV